MDTIDLKGTRKDGKESVFSVSKTEKILDLKNMQLLHLDLSPLVECKSLSTLVLAHNELVELDLSPLARNAEIEILILSSNKLAALDLSPLARCVNLEKIWVNFNRLSQLDLSPLAGCYYLDDIRIDDSVELFMLEELKTRELPSGLASLEEYITWVKKPRKGFQKQLDDVPIPGQNRMQKLGRIISRTRSLELEKLVTLLEFTDDQQLLDWLYNLPENYQFTVEESRVRFKGVIDNADDQQSEEKEVVTKRMLFPFYCQICQENKGASISRYQCQECNRFTCEDCYQAALQTGYDRCSMCEGELKKL
ncbi:MAG: hypothetical protein ACFFD4_09810 [Candidatus Odinarchaeota archaeon]